VLEIEEVHHLFVSGITHRLGEIFTALRAGVAAQSAYRRMTGLLIIRIWGQLHWIEKRLYSALTRAAAGQPPRISGPRPAREAAATAVPRKLRLSRREGWLIPLMPPSQPRHIAAAYAGQVQHVLANPEFAPYLTHPSVIRALRPLCRMLGITDSLPEPAPRDAPPGSFIATPAPAALATKLPPPPPPASDPWATCAQPTVDLYPRQNLYRAI
jgi:hypothetical protein